MPFAWAEEHRLRVSFSIRHSASYTRKCTSRPSSLLRSIIWLSSFIKLLCRVCFPRSGRFPHQACGWLPFFRFSMFKCCKTPFLMASDCLPLPQLPLLFALFSLFDIIEDCIHGNFHTSTVSPLPLHLGQDGLKTPQVLWSMASRHHSLPMRCACLSLPRFSASLPSMCQ